MVTVTVACLRVIESEPPGQAGKKSLVSLVPAPRTFTLLTFFFLSFGCVFWHTRSQFPDQGSNCAPCVLTTGLPGKSPFPHFF